jgi:hypothetical protein
MLENLYSRAPGSLWCSQTLWACRRSCAIDGLFGLGKSRTRYSRLESKRLGPKCGALICVSYSHQCQKTYIRLMAFQLGRQLEVRHRNLPRQGDVC